MVVEDKIRQSFDCDLLCIVTVSGLVDKAIWVRSRVCFSHVDLDVLNWGHDRICCNSAANFDNEPLFGGESLEDCLSCVSGEFYFT